MAKIDRKAALDNLTRAKLVEEVTVVTGLHRHQAEKIVRTVFDTLIEALRDGNRIEIRGFGSFGLRHRKPRIGLNPRNLEKVQVPAKRVAFFKPGKVLRDIVNP